MAVARNTGEVRFGTSTAAWARPTHISMWRGGVLQGASPITNPPLSVGAGVTVRFQANQFSVTLPRGEATEDFAGRALAAGVGAIVELRLHSGDPGADGTANQIAGNGYQHANATVAVV